MPRKHAKKNDLKVIKVSITYYCPWLGKEAVYDIDLDSNIDCFYAYSDHCTMCGGHGAIQVTVPCECKKTEHSLLIDNW